MLKFNKTSLSLILSCFFLLNSCGGTKATKDTPTNALERARKNVQEGRGISLGNVLKKGSSNYEFSTSNPLWRATLEILDFIPLTTVDYSGGIIITDWYNESTKANDSIKITIRFLTNEVRSDSIKVIVHQRVCDKSNLNCKINQINSIIKNELISSIIKKASVLEQESKKK